MKKTLRKGLARNIGSVVGNFSDSIGKYRRASNLLKSNDFSSFYEEFNSLWQIQNVSNKSTWSDFANIDGSEIEKMMMMDANIYLPDNVLTKVDRATMHASLEGREPLLDFRLIELSYQISNDLKYRESKGKWILRKLLSNYLPEHIVNRPKKGFAIPINHWLKNYLKDWCSDGLDYLESRDDILLPKNEINKAFDQHQSGQKDRSSYLWNAVILSKWLQHNEG